MNSKRKRPSRQTAPGKAHKGNDSGSNYNKFPREPKAQKRPTGKVKPIIRHLPHGNPDQKWFKAHPDRTYRIRPKRYDEPGEGFAIIKQLYPGGRSLVGIGPEGVMLADTDETLGKVYDLRRAGKAGMIFLHDGTVIGEGEGES